MHPIDFVLAWVDGSDPVWQDRKKAFRGKDSTDDLPERYRDWGLLRYWFRGVDRYAPWVRKVFLICDQEPPKWLRKDCPKLQIIRHEDYLPAEYRPAYSSHPIELNIHRIGDLSEHFVYFNDDMFLLRPVTEDLFFHNGLPRDAALLNPIPTTDLRKREDGRIFTVPLNNAEYLNRDYDFRSCIKGNRLKWLSPLYGKRLIRNMIFLSWPRFVGFEEPHIPQSFLKSAFEKAWEQDADILNETSLHQLRDDRDVNQWLIRGRQLAEGCVVPRSVRTGRMFDLDRESEEAVRAIREQKSRMICLNDGPMEQEQFLRTREALWQAFQEILPTPSRFETEAAEQET